MMSESLPHDVIVNIMFIFDNDYDYDIITMVVTS